MYNNNNVTMKANKAKKGAENEIFDARFILLC